MPNKQIKLIIYYENCCVRKKKLKWKNNFCLTRKMFDFLYPKNLYNCIHIILAFFVCFISFCFLSFLFLKEYCHGMNLVRSLTLLYSILNLLLCYIQTYRTNSFCALQNVRYIEASISVCNILDIQFVRESSKLNEQQKKEPRKNTNKH